MRIFATDAMKVLHLPARPSVVVVVHPLSGTAIREAQSNWWTGSMSRFQEIVEATAGGRVGFEHFDEATVLRRGAVSNAEGLSDSERQWVARQILELTFPKHTCAGCGETFHPSGSAQRHCRPSCRELAARNREQAQPALFTQALASGARD